MSTHPRTNAAEPRGETIRESNSEIDNTLNTDAGSQLQKNPGRQRWLFPLLVVFVIAVPVLGLNWQRRRSGSNSATPPTRVPAGEEGARTATLDEALDIARKGLARMEAELVDYRGRMVKREQVGGQLGPVTEMLVKIRTRRTGDIQGVQPQSMAVYLEFLLPETMKGREVIWVEDRNNGKLVAHDTGLASLISVSLDPKGFLAMQGNRYPITDIGFKNLVRQLMVRGKLIEQEGGANVTFIDPYNVGDRECVLIQVRPHATNGSPKENTRIDFSLAEIAIDKERQIPLRYAAYGISRSGENQPELLEEYTYFDVETNVGLTDLDFDKDNPAYAFP